MVDACALLNHKRTVWDMRDQKLYAIPVDVVLNFPTEEAEPVKHGRWTADESTYTDGEAQCSICKTTYYMDDLYWVGEKAQSELPNYCPHCGAKMDGAERKEE